MVKKTAVILNKTGLHARPAYHFVNTAKQYQSDITVSYQGISHNAKSVIDVLGGCIGSGAEIEITTDGPDEQEALQMLIQDIAAGLGEE